MSAILMTKEYWHNSQLSIARFWGQCELNGVTYVIVDKTGKDLRHTSIPPGEPADMVDKRFLKYYRKLGRERFIEVLEQHPYASEQELGKILKELIKKEKK